MSITAIPTKFDAAVNELRPHITGSVFSPGSDRYDAARRSWDLTVDQYPSVIVVAATVDDIAEAVRFARRVDAPIAVQATGHGSTRPADGAVLIVTAELTAVSVDPVNRTAYVSAGAKWGAVLSAAQVFGLAPLLGSSTDVGAIGYTLGGGMGWLARRYGLAADSAIAFDIVTPLGIKVRASADEHAELFWALKGGGAGSLGVVSGMEIELHPMHTVYGGNLLYPVEMAHDVMARWRDWIVDVPEELTSAVVIMNFPPFEEVPEPVRGRSFVIVRGAWSGDLAAGETLIDQWRTWRTPAIDMFGPMPLTEAGHISNDPVDPMPAGGTTEWFDTLPDAAIDVLVGATVSDGFGPPPLVFSEIRHAGGAMRTKASGTANERGRSGEMVLYMLGLAADGASAEALDAPLTRTRQQLAPFVTGAAYLNFLNGMERQRRTPEAYHDDQRQRLADIKGAVDPDNRFTHGFAITRA